MATQTVFHTLDPIYGPESHTLILGTMPSPRSRACGFYYAHPQNRFWRALSAVYGEAVPPDTAAQQAFILAHGLALWDVLARCDIGGASDASIRNPVPNDIAWLAAAAPIRRIFTTGAAATRLYRRLCEPRVGLPCTMLPSPSAANCRLSLDSLTAAYGALREAAAPPCV